MACTDHCYMNLMYLGNTNADTAQMSEILSHYDSSACCSTIHIAIPRQSNIIFGESKTNSPHLKYLVLHISWAGSCVPMLHSIAHDNGSVSWLPNGDV